MSVDNIKEKIEELVSKLQSDKSLAEKFKSDPVKTVEGLVGVDLPDDTVKKIVDGVKAKISLDKLGGAAGDIKDKLKKLF